MDNFLINPFKPRDTRLSIKTFYVLPIECICVFMWISEQTAIISPYNIN